jgi:hypothetical protein
VKLDTITAIARRACDAQRAGDALAASRLRVYVLAHVRGLREAFGRELASSVFEAIPVDALPAELLAACTHPAVRESARVYASARRQKGASARTYRAWETRRERDEAVTVNIPPELLSLWRRVRSTIHGATAHERVERFMEYAETDEGERASVSAMQDAADAKLAELLRGAA